MNEILLGVVNVSNQGSNTNIWDQFHGPNMGYVEEQYEKFLEDPSTVDSSLQAIFEEYGAPEWMASKGESAPGVSQASDFDVQKYSQALKLVEAIRRHGHLEADIYPVGKRKNRYSPLVDPKTYGLT